jgi:phosphoadenosine phosphosulfate reductase
LLIDFEAKSAEQLLEWAIVHSGERFAILTSFQAEGMVVLDIASRINPAIRVITLDTERLPVQTHQMIATVQSRYRTKVEIVSPDPQEVSSMTNRFGPDLFYEGQAQRNLCCEVRKIRPLAKKLASVDVYAVGLRHQQSDTRRHVLKAEELDGRTKLSPLADWTRDAVWRYIRDHDVPVHPLYASGYTSIGCAPCTRAVQPGDDERAGRWWWENDNVKECGIHFSVAGKAERTVDVLLAEVLAR